MMLGTPKPAVATHEALLFTGGFINSESQRPVWIYRDHQGKVQGPFPASSMLQWYSTGRLPQDLLVCGVTQPVAAQALEAIPVSCFQPLNRLMQSAAQGVQYRPITIATQAAATPMVQSLPQAQVIRPAMIGNATGGVQMQQVNMQLGSQPAQGAMALPAAVRPAAPQLQPAFRPNMGGQQLVQLQAPVMQQQQAQPNLVMLQQQPQQVIMTGQQQAPGAVQPMMLVQQQQQQAQPRPVIQLQSQPLRPRLQQPMQQQQVVLQQVPAGRVAAPQQAAGSVMLQQVPQQPNMQLQAMQQQNAMRPVGVAGVSMPGSAVAVRPGQPLMVQQQQALLQGAAGQLQPAVGLQQPQLVAGSTPPAGRDAAAAHVAQRLEHLAAQAQARAGPVPLPVGSVGGPVPPLQLDKLGNQMGPASGTQQQLTGAFASGSARSTTNSFNNLDMLVKQANATAAASGPSSAGAPAGLLPNIRTVSGRRSSGAGSALGLQPTPRAGSAQPGATPTGLGMTPGSARMAAASDGAIIDDVLFDLVEDVAVDVGEGPRQERKPATTATPAATAPVPSVFLATAKPASASLGGSPLPQQLVAGGQTGVAAVLRRQSPGATGLLATAGNASGQGLMGNAMHNLSLQQQQQQVLLLQTKQQQQLGQQQQQQQALLQQQARQQHFAQQQQLQQQQQQQQQQAQLQLLQQQQQVQLQQQQQQAQLQQQQQQAQLQQQQQAQLMLAQQQQRQQPAATASLTGQERQQQLLQAAMQQLQAGGNPSEALAALQQLRQQLQDQPTAPPASQPSGTSAAGASGLFLSALDPQHQQQPPAASSAATAAASQGGSSKAADSGTKEFNPWGLSFMDPVIMQEPAPKAAELQQAARPSSTQPGQAAPNQLTQEEVLAALMPELDAVGLSAEQKLALLKDLLGRQQQNKQGQDAAGLTPAAQPAAAAAVAPVQGVQQPQQQQGQQQLVSQDQQQQQQGPTGLQQLFQQANQPQQGQAADKQQAPQKPQHVWLQQLANNSKAGTDAGAQKGKGGGKEGPGSEGGDEFDPSMLPADLFDFLDGHSSPSRKADHHEGELGSRAESSWWSSTHQDEQLSGDQQDDFRPHKYVPPGRRTSAESWQSSVLQTRTSSTGTGSVPPPPPPPPSWTARESSAGRGGSTYVPPHARERGSSPPPGYSRASSSTGGPAGASDREREQRIQAQQQMLPPHLRIVPQEPGQGPEEGYQGPLSQRERYEGGRWPPPPPPQPHSQAAPGWDESSSRRAPYVHREPPTAGEEDGKGKLRRLFEAATAGSGGAAGVPRPPPPPPGGPHPRPPPPDGSSRVPPGQWDSPQPQRVPPGFESEFPQGPPSARGPPNRDWDHAAGPEGYSQGYSRSGEGAGGGEYRGSGWAGTGRGYGSSSAGYQGEWDGADQARGRGPPSDRRHMEADWEQQRGGDGHYGERHTPYPPSSHEGDYDDRRYYGEYDEHGRQHPPQHRDAPRGSPRGYGPPVPPPPRARYDEEHYPPAYPLRQPAPPPPREGRPGASSRQEMAGWGDAEGGGEPRSLTWQQQQMLHEYDDDEPAGARGRQQGWQEGSGYWDERTSPGDVRPPERDRHRSPEPGARRSAANGSPPSGHAPQPSQHLRAAAHTAARRAPPPAKPGRESGGGSSSRGGSRPPPADLQARYHEDFPVLGSTSWPSSSSKGYAEALMGEPAQGKDASAAAMAAVAGLKPTVTVAPPRAPAGKAARRSPTEGYYAGPQMPSVEETKAAVMAALGSGPGSTGLCRTTSGGSNTGLKDAVQQHVQDSRPSAGAEDGPGQLRKGSGSSTGEGSATAAAAAAPRRNVVAATGLFSNVIGQLRRQSTARDCGDAADASDEVYGSLGDGDDAGGSRGSYLTAASGRGRRSGPGEANAADLVLAAINSTRQRASKMSSKRQAAQETAAAGKADAAWQGPSDTANSCDSSSGSAQQQEAA